MTPVIVQRYQPRFVLLSFLTIFELHLHESEASAFTCGRVSHYYGVCHMAVIFEVCNEVGLLRLEGETTDKKFDLIFGSLLVELRSMGGTARDKLRPKCRIQGGGLIP